MKKYLFVLLIVMLPVIVNSQNNESKYLEGAVPEINGKVVFFNSIETTIPVSSEKLFPLIENWAKRNYSQKDDLNSRILLLRPETDEIVCYGEEYLVFQKSALSLDRAKMSYQIILKIKNDTCDITIRNIRYNYIDDKNLVTAEDRISDKYALNKNKNKLNKYYDKFRILTIDSINNIYKSLDIYLNGYNQAGVTSKNNDIRSYKVETNKELPQEEDTFVNLKPKTETSTKSTSLSKQTAGADSIDNNMTNKSTLIGYKSLNPRDLRQEFVTHLSSDIIATTNTSDRINRISSLYGGLGILFDKPIIITLMETRDHFSLNEKENTYTLSFYEKESISTDQIPISNNTKEPNENKASLIIECKKSFCREIPEDSNILKNITTKKQDILKQYSILIGEISQIWIKN